MQNLINELRNGTPIYQVNEDGLIEGLIETRPPTSKELRAANAIEQLMQVRNGLEQNLFYATAELQMFRERRDAELARRAQEFATAQQEQNSEVAHQPV